MVFAWKRVIKVWSVVTEILNLRILSGEFFLVPKYSQSIYLLPTHTFLKLCPLKLVSV